jgi:hypothetical protein
MFSWVRKTVSFHRFIIEVIDSFLDGSSGLRVEYQHVGLHETQIYQGGPLGNA